MLVSLDIDTTDKDLKGNKLYRVLRTKAIKGKTVPFTEIAPTRAKPALTKEKLAGIMEQINSSEIKQKKKEQL